MPVDALTTRPHIHVYLLMAVVTQRLQIVHVVGETFHVGITDATLYRRHVMDALRRSTTATLAYWMLTDDAVPQTTPPHAAYQLYISA